MKILSKYGSLSEELQRKIKKANDPQVLERVLEKAIYAESMEAFCEEITWFSTKKREE